MTTREKLIERMKMVIEDCEVDASQLDGKAFNGRNVAQLFGQQLAMIGAIADAVRQLAEEPRPPSGPQQ